VRNSPALPSAQHDASSQSEVSESDKELKVVVTVPYPKRVSQQYALAAAMAQLGRKVC